METSSYRSFFEKGISTFVPKGEFGWVAKLPLIKETKIAQGVIILPRSVQELEDKLSKIISLKPASLPPESKEALYYCELSMTNLDKTLELLWYKGFFYAYESPKANPEAFEKYITDTFNKNVSPEYQEQFGNWQLYTDYDWNSLLVTHPDDVGMGLPNGPN